MKKFSEFYKDCLDKMVGVLPLETKWHTAVENMLDRIADTINAHPITLDQCELERRLGALTDEVKELKDHSPRCEKREEVVGISWYNCKCQNPGPSSFLCVHGNFLEGRKEEKAKWRPSDGEDYWTFSLPNYDLMCCTFRSMPGEMMAENVGLVFKTRALAEQAMEKVRELLLSLQQ